MEEYTGSNKNVFHSFFVKIGSDFKSIKVNYLSELNEKIFFLKNQ